ncbi:Sulfate transporter [Georgfuchsia toluolica]|uniref:Sulfate transporter n=1 Tax=Georgfuchsia toluolica TaxID=424218 RepID=A0A916J0B0_9PROT|nr:SulP family inorganic anion transporter [Georgfuchsia toluolica]CAG4882330.1 Sulfate transporter [Georgfuchsia toluolica]
MKALELNAGDFWGGLTAMLVALPSAIAFGVTIYASLGGSYAAYGALAGILGATALGLVASIMGGTKRLISAPCAPAAALLAAFAIEQMQGGASATAVILLLTVLGMAAGLLQIIFGSIGFGQFIKYMPYPVVSGYLSGVGLVIIGSQVPKFLGAPSGTIFSQALSVPALWAWQGVAVGAVTMLAMLFAPHVTQRVPAAILALLAGIVAYFGLSLGDAALLNVHNPLVIGPLTGAGTGSFVDALHARWQGLGDIGIRELGYVAVPALTLAVLLSIDTLKTCVVLDALTHSRHDSNRELIGQGLGNVASAVIGGMPGAGQMGATLVNLSAGARSRYSGFMEGALSLLAFLLFGSLISWVPVAALAAILIVVGVRMIDRHSFQFLRQRSTILDFGVIAAVVATALTVSLIAASGVGIVLAVMLFVREQIGGSIVHRKSYGNENFSKCIRSSEEMEILTERGNLTVIVELQGGLFFGTADQLYTALEPELKTRDFVILDMRRVQTVDVTAVHMLDQVKDMLAERQGFLIFSQLPHSLPSGRDMQQYFDQVGLVRPESPVRVFNELDDALEWVENRVLDEALCKLGEREALGLGEIELFSGRKAETLLALEQCTEKRSYKAGDKIFARGETGDELFLIRRGAVRIVLPISDKQSHHLGTFGRGAFFGEMAFLDGDRRSADAIAFSDAELYVLSRKVFDKFAEEHKKLALGLMEGLASVLASRLRYTNAELRMLES